MIFYVIVRVTCLIAVIQAKTHYLTDIVDVNCNTTEESIVHMELQITRPSRGVQGISGIIDIKNDVNTDNALASFKVYYSTNSVSYTLTPFGYGPSVFTNALNSVYKEYLMESSRNCCENAIYFEGKFVPPLKKRRMICEHCALSGDNFPSNLRLGYYKIVITVDGEFPVDLMILFKLEKE